MSLQDIIREHEERRREREYGVAAKLKQLYIAFAVTVAVYIVSELSARSEGRRPVQHVVIDHVLVEVVPDTTATAWVARISGWACVAAVTAIALVRISAGGTQKQKPDAVGAAHQRTAGAATEKTADARYSLRPSKPPQATHAAWWMPSTSNKPTVLNALVAPSAGGDELQSKHDLDVYLLKQNSRQIGVAEGNALYAQSSTGASSFAAMVSRPGLFAAPTVTAGSAPGILLRYDEAGAERLNGGQRLATTAESELAALGVAHVERSLLRVRQWVSTICKGVVDDVDLCNQWFSDKRIKQFDCSNPLSEWWELPTASAAPRPGGFGVAAAPAAPEKVRKWEALANERKKLQMQSSSNMETFDSIAKLELRMALEHVLDVSRTFPATGGQDLPAAVVGRRQRGIIQRLRAFAGQRSMQGFQCGCESPDVPPDPYLVAHVLRSRVPALANYILLPYQQHSSTAVKDLVLYVGGSGDPYFYVRHRYGGAQEKQMRTTEGAESLFEALLLFFAVVRRHYNGSYGNVEGMIDLKQLNVESIF